MLTEFKIGNIRFFLMPEVFAYNMYAILWFRMISHKFFITMYVICLLRDC